MSGAAWWRDEVPEGLGVGYTRAILRALSAGLDVFEWKMIKRGDLEFEIMRAPLAIGTLDDHIFALGLTAEAVDLIALRFEALGEPVMSPTPYLYDLAAEHDQQVQIGPHTLPSLIGQQNGAAGMTKSAAAAHGAAIAADRPHTCSFVSACCKTYVLYPLEGGGIRPGYAVEYGWRLPGRVGWGSKASTGPGYVVQPAQWAHSYRAFADYSMGAVFVKAWGRVRGRSVDLREIALGGAETALVSPSGPVPYVVHPECRRDLLGASQGDDTDPAPPSFAPWEGPALSLGSKSPAVGAWQRILIAAGFSLAPWGDDDDFGKATHNATVGFQRERGLVADGVVGPATWGARDAAPVERPEPDGEITATIPATNYTRANRTTVDLVVVHTIEGVEASTTGDRTAEWFGSGKRAPQASAHYVFDDDSTISCVPEEHVSWAAPSCNRNGIQLEHTGFARQDLAAWQDPFSRRMLARSAKMTAAICARWNIPIRFVDAAGLMRGERGITTHYQVSKGPGKGRTNHYDPGKGFPMSSYLEAVRKAAP